MDTLSWTVRRQALKLGGLVVMLSVVLPVMLLGRQWVQKISLTPLRTTLQEQNAPLEEVLQPNESSGANGYPAHLNTGAEIGQVVYDSNCSLCHGGAPGTQPSASAGQMAVPPEILVSVRSTQPYIQQRLQEGVPGSGMPSSFTSYTDDNLEDLILHLDRAYGVLSPPEPLTLTVVAAARQEAHQIFDQTCVSCHGSNGTGQTPVAQTLKPSPPNFQEFTLSPQRSFEVISNGYPGTQMPAYGHLAEDVRWGLVVIVEDFYLPGYPSVHDQ
jgi:mono/diheme cytochrome c family protein